LACSCHEGSVVAFLVLFVDMITCQSDSLTTTGDPLESVGRIKSCGTMTKDVFT
jgi:hypothetical protein